MLFNSLGFLYVFLPLTYVGFWLLRSRNRHAWAQCVSATSVRLDCPSATSASSVRVIQPWRFMVAGKVVSENPRYIMLSDAVFHHWAHHRGQLTVYLRLNDAIVPAMVIAIEKAQGIGIAYNRQ